MCIYVFIFVCVCVCVYLCIFYTAIIILNVCCLLTCVYTVTSAVKFKISNFFFPVRFKSLIFRYLERFNGLKSLFLV